MKGLICGNRGSPGDRTAEAKKFCGREQKLDGLNKRNNLGIKHLVNSISCSTNKMLILQGTISVTHINMCN